MRILVYGGTGYIGSSLVTLLSIEGHVIANVSRKKNLSPNVCNYHIEQDVQNIIESFEPDIVIYLSACFDNNNVKDIIKINIELPVKVLNVLVDFGDCKFFYIGSYWQFGNAEAPNIPIDLYSAAKRSMISFMDYYNQYTNLFCKEIVIYGTYGDSDGRGKLLDYLLECTIRGSVIKLTGGEQLLNLSPVKNVCYEISNQINNNCRKVQILSERNYTPRDLVLKIKKIIPIDVEFGAIPYRDVELMKPHFDNGYQSVYIKDEINEYLWSKINKNLN